MHQVALGALRKVVDCRNSMLRTWMGVNEKDSLLEAYGNVLIIDRRDRKSEKSPKTPRK
jgi:hypothetical protein